MEIVVIDGSDNDNSYLKMHRAAVSDALIVSSVENMVNRIRELLGVSGRMGRLVIVGHGNSGVIGVGDGEGGRNPHLAGHLQVGEQITEASPGLQVIELDARGNLRGRTSLGLLTGRFVPGAVVELQGCQIARGHAGRELLRQLADLWQVTVRASVDSQYGPGHPRARPGLSFEGQVIEARPTPGHHSRVRLVR
jgi:hypothetical protein